jgi:glycosyltransferase involved in cell wall biosynthesis
MAIPLSVLAPVYGSSGYATAARNFLLALAATGRYDLGLDLLQWNTGFGIAEAREVLLTLQTLQQRRQHLGSGAALLHWSIASEFQGRQGFRRAIGHTVFETNSLLQSFVAGCNRMDAIMVPTAFNRENFRRAGVKVPIEVVHEGVDTQRYTPEGPTLKVIPPRFTFLYMAQLSYRKGFDLALKAFLELFARHDDVQLVLRCYLRDGSAEDQAQMQDIVRLFREQELGGLKSGHVYLMTNVPDAHMPALYRSVQAVVAPFRGEGWGLPLIEALACETPVIATGWGGATEFLTPDIATLLPYTLQPIPQDVPDLFLGGHLRQARSEGHYMAEPAYGELKARMWDCYQNYFSYKAQAVAGREHLMAHFQWQHAAQQFRETMETYL